MFRFIFTLMLFQGFYISAQEILVVDLADGVDVKAKIVEKKIYFKLRRINEKENSTYMLSRVNKVGDQKLIGTKAGFKNEMNQHISYAFKDDALSPVCAMYYLVQITEEGSAILATFEYQPNQRLTLAE